MTAFGPAHPLDVDLADLVEGVLDEVRAAQVEAHLTHCLLCLVKRQRLAEAPPATLLLDQALVAPEFTVPGGGPGPETGPPAVAELWLTGTVPRVLVVVLRVDADRATDRDPVRILVAPVTFDVEAADEETVVVGADRSPLGAGLAVHPALATEVPASVLAERIGSFGTLDVLTSSVPDGVSAVAGASDPRLEVRQHLADQLGSIEERSPDPGTAGDAPPPGPEHLRSALIGDVRALRGQTCAVRPLYDWGDVLLAHRAGWVPVATLDELGVVLIVLDTPHGLADDADFDAARSVLTRFNGTALVVLAGAISDLADVFDSSSLNHGIDTPSGRHTPPRPLIAGLTPFDAIGKYLDQSTGARAAAPPSRGPVTRVDVGAILHEAAAAAVADAVRQGARFKIAPKRRGYESLADDGERLQIALAGAFGPTSVVENILGLAPLDPTFLGPTFRGPEPVADA